MPCCRSKRDAGAQTWICGNLTHGRFCFSSCVLDRLTPVPTLSGVPVRSMSCGRAHTLIAAENGTVFSWGWNMYGQLGQGNTSDVYAPAPLAHFQKAGAIARKVCCGESFSIVICSEGVYSFGRNHEGQLGLGYSWATSACNTPQRICLDARELASGYSQKAGAAKWDVACGGNHALILRLTDSSTPELFSWGQNGEGQCGVGTIGVLLQPARVMLPDALLRDTPKRIACGMSHSVILSRGGRVYTFGDGSQGQLGLGTNNSRLMPSLVTSLEDQLVSNIICGNAHTMCLSQHCERVFSWGSNQCGELGTGNGSVTCSLHPTLVDMVSFKGDRVIEAIGSGPCANHTLLLTSLRLPWSMTRLLLAGALRGDPSTCMLARLPQDGNLSCSLLRSILDRVAANR